ncbi:MAG: gliding motility-associated C-terminal domain-containing protein, partial [Candidatus Latescibacterota bacterium]|nr:gliding motility-associated C-terminal domain-containing protein [Candidatus Latescibacterota bacterium]
IQDSRAGDAIRQRVDPGDATDQAAGNTNVVALPVVRDLLIKKIRRSLVLSPNGDGVNDRIEVALDVVNVALPRPLRIGVFSLSGQLVYEETREVVAGPQLLGWDGQDLTHALVPPGIYLLDIRISGDAREQSQRYIASVVY